MKDLVSIASNFSLEGTVTSVSPLGNGLINDTYKVTTAGDSPDYVLQRINNAVFPDVEMLQRNIAAVTGHIRAGLIASGEEDIDRKVLRFIPLKDSKKTFFFDGELYWRVSVFINDARTYETVDPKYSFFAGKAFGNFEAMLSDLKEEIGEVIPNFHNIEFRLWQLAEAVKANKAGRLTPHSHGLHEILEDIDAHGVEMCKGEQLFREGKLPKRICHCDTKVNNMMFDADGNVLCVIDLDTVMPSFVFSDYGDFLRTGASTLPEDDPDIDGVDFRMDIFEAFTRGYLEGTASFLTKVEKENLPYAACLFPFMQAVRFFADYLDGDVYYKTKYPDHNLVRTRNQLKLFHSAMEKVPAMQRFIAEL